MDEEGERRVRAKSSGEEVDRFSNLPESLKFQILLNLPTKDVVKSSVLSKRWRDLWPLVPGLDLESGDFPDCDAFVTFVNRFLGFNSSPCLQKLKLESQSFEAKYKWNWDEADVAHVTWWINTVLKRKVHHLHVLNITSCEYEVEMPLSIYTCESLVSLELRNVILPNPKSVSLTSVKVINLSWVKFANSWAFEMFISGCPFLESLSIERSPSDNVKVLRVCSQSLLSFHIVAHFGDPFDEELVVAIDAPRLEDLQLYDEDTDIFIINNLDSLAKVGIGIVFNLSSEKRFDPNDLPKRNMIRNFLIGISRVKDMTIASDTLQAIYNLSRCEGIPLFRNLSSLCADFEDYRWEVLPIFLESCPNLKSLSLGFTKPPWKEEGVSILPGPRRFLTSLEYVKILQPMVEETTQMNLMSYLLKNSTVLKEFTYCLSGYRKKEKKEESVILEKLLSIPRLSSSCQFTVL